MAFSPSHQADMRWKASHAASSEAALASTSMDAPAGIHEGIVTRWKLFSIGARRRVTRQHMGIMTFLHERLHASGCWLAPESLPNRHKMWHDCQAHLYTGRSCQHGCVKPFAQNRPKGWKARQASCNASSPVGALAEGGEGLDSTPSAACSAASLPARPARVAIVHISTMRDRLTPLGDAAVTAPAQPAQRKFQSHDSCGCHRCAAE